VANRWCDLLPVGSELKQRMMSLDAPLLRLELVSDVLEKLRLDAGR
jgi:Lon protease-like protein